MWYVTYLNLNSTMAICKNIVLTPPELFKWRVNSNVYPLHTYSGIQNKSSSGGGEGVIKVTHNT